MWHERLRTEPGIEGPTARVPGIPVCSFFLRDPAGCRVEIQAFTDPSTVDRLKACR